MPHTCDSEAEARYVGTAGRAKLADECGEKFLVCWCVAETMRYWHAPFSVVRYAIHAEVYECFTPSPRQHRSLLAVTSSRGNGRDYLSTLAHNFGNRHIGWLQPVVSIMPRNNIEACRFKPNREKQSSQKSARTSQKSARTSQKFARTSENLGRLSENFGVCILIKHMSLFRGERANPNF